MTASRLDILTRLDAIYPSTDWPYLLDQMDEAGLVVDIPTPSNRDVPLFEGTVASFCPLDDGKGEVNLIGSPLRPLNPNGWETVVVVYPKGDR